MQQAQRDRLALVFVAVVAGDQQHGGARHAFQHRHRHAHMAESMGIVGMRHAQCADATAGAGKRDLTMHAG